VSGDRPSATTCPVGPAAVARPGSGLPPRCRNRPGRYLLLDGGHRPRRPRRRHDPVPVAARPL